MKPEYWLASRIAARMEVLGDPAQRRALAAEVLAALGETYHPEAVAQVEAQLQAQALPADIDWPPTVNSLALVARLAARHQAWVQSRSAWDGFFQRQSRPDPMDLLAYARVCSALNDHQAAANALRRALRERPDYNFFSRAGKLIDTVKAKATGGYVRECRVAVLGSSTVALFVPALKALAWRDGIDAQFYSGLYNAIDQEILDPSSGMSAFGPTVVVLVNHWRDLDLPAISSDVDQTVQAVLERFQRLWQILAERYSCQVVQQAFDFPVAESFGALSQTLPGGRGRVIEKVNRALIDHAPSHVAILDTASVQRTAAEWDDPAMWYNFQQHPTTKALPALAELHAAHLRAILGLTRKVLIVDLDNTLWKGVIGEDGLDGIGIGPGSPAGEAHMHLQGYMAELKSRGILLAVCSKNNPADAELPFREHPNMKLRLDDFAAFRANWQDKATNIREIAEELSLGLDSFVFLDDSPMEREWVRSQLPQVEVVECGESALGFQRALDRGRYFFATTLSKEDLKRADSYRESAQRERLRATAVSMDEFLAQLQLRATVSPVTTANLARVTQLINKTNQFNVTTRRYTEAQVGSTAAASDAWMAAFSLDDRVGSYGLIGVIIARGSGDRRWEVDTWLMSCRVLGRQMEKFMFDQLVSAAAGRGIQEIDGIYRPTEKNGLVKELFPQLGFSFVEQSESGFRYRYRIPETIVPTATHVRHVEA